MAHSVEHDHYPEVVENGQGTRRLELLGIDESLDEPAERRQFFAELSDEQFAHMTGYINSVTRGQRINYDYADGVFWEGKTPRKKPPPLEDKEPLMNMAFAAVREITADTSLDDRTALRRAGLAMAGALNYIHAYTNGNGRTSRVMQYLIEFGTERGEKAVNEELYAIIGKLPVYDTDATIAIDNIPHPALDRALTRVTARKNPEQYAHLSGRQKATANVMTFLDMMRGAIDVPIDERVVMKRTKEGRGFSIEYAEPGTIDGVALTENEYLRMSTISNRGPDDVPEGAQRVLVAQKQPPPAIGDTVIKLELVD